MQDNIEIYEKEREMQQKKRNKVRLAVTLTGTLAILFTFLIINRNIEKKDLEVNNQKIIETGDKSNNTENTDEAVNLEIVNSVEEFIGINKKDEDMELLKFIEKQDSISELNKEELIELSEQLNSNIYSGFQISLVSNGKKTEIINGEYIDGEGIAIYSLMNDGEILMLDLLNDFSESLTTKRVIIGVISGLINHYHEIEHNQKVKFSTIENNFYQILDKNKNILAEYELKFDNNILYIMELEV